MLKINNLNINYGGINAVRDVSFEVEEGSIITLVGANGAGKSSILRSIAGVVTPTSGTIEESHPISSLMALEYFASRTM